MAKIRVLLVDYHDLIRYGLRRLLEDKGIEVVDEANSGEQALDKVRKFKPDEIGRAHV